MSGHICSSHLQDLQGRLRHKGLARLIRPERAKLFAERWVKGVATAEEFDPLIVSVLEIRSKAMQMGIPLSPAACMLCSTNKAMQNADAAKSWIDNVTDLMLLVAETNNLRIG